MQYISDGIPILKDTKMAGESRRGAVMRLPTTSLVMLVKLHIFFGNCR